MRLRLPALFPLLILLSLNGCNKASTSGPKSTTYWQLFTSANSRLSHNSIRNITIASDRKVWLSTINGASGFDNGTWTVIHDSLKTPNMDPKYNPTYAPVNDIVEAKDRALWFCLPGGLVRFNQQSAIKVWSRWLVGYDVVAGSADLSNQTVYGQLWFAAGNLGVQRFEQTIYENGNFTSYTQADGTPLPSTVMISCATKPDDFSVWFGGSSGGLASASSASTGVLTWTHYAPPDADQRINAIGFDINGNVWCGQDTDVAVYNINTANWKVYSNASTNGQMPKAIVLSLVTDYKTTRWFGTDSGLVRFQDSVWTRFNKANSIIPNDSITALQFDSFKNLWIGTPAGAVVYNPDGIRYE